MTDEQRARLEAWRNRYGDMSPEERRKRLCEFYSQAELVRRIVHHSMLVENPNWKGFVDD